MPRQPRTFYAAHRPYGLTALNTNGPRADVLHGFAGEADRDAWVAADPERREALAAGANDVRAALRFERRDGYRVVARHAAGDRTGSGEADWL